MHYDHDPLLQLEMEKEYSGKLMYWFLWLHEIDFELEHVQDNVVNNALCSTQQ